MIFDRKEVIVLGEKGAIVLNDCNKCTNALRFVDSGGGCVCVGAGSTWMFSVLLSFAASSK